MKTWPIGPTGLTLSTIERHYRPTAAQPPPATLDRMKYTVIHEGAMCRGRRSEGRWVGEVEADSYAEAERLACEKWPRLTLTLIGGPGGHVASMPSKDR